MANTDMVILILLGMLSTLIVWDWAIDRKWFRSFGIFFTSNGGFSSVGKIPLPARIFWRIVAANPPYTGEFAKIRKHAKIYKDIRKSIWGEDTGIYRKILIGLLLAFPLIAPVARAIFEGKPIPFR